MYNALFHSKGFHTGYCMFEKNVSLVGNIRTLQIKNDMIIHI